LGYESRPVWALAKCTTTGLPIRLQDEFAGSRMTDSAFESTCEDTHHVRQPPDSLWSFGSARSAGCSVRRFPAPGRGLEAVSRTERQRRGRRNLSGADGVLAD